MKPVIYIQIVARIYAILTFAYVALLVLMMAVLHQAPLQIDWFFLAVGFLAAFIGNWSVIS